MNGIFDLGRIKKLIEAEHPAAALVIDTGTVRDVPNLNQLKACSGKLLFILPCLEQVNLHSFKNIPAKKEDFRTVSSDLSGLFLDGRIMEGIYQNHIGWYIAVPVPGKESLEDQVKTLDLVVNTFGQNNTSLIILTKELRDAFPVIPLIILTQNTRLHNALEFMGIKSALLTQFNLSDLEKTLSGRKAASLDWDEVLRGIQTSEGRSLVQVEMSLVSRSSAPFWVNGSIQDQGQTSILLAQGTGVVHSYTDLRFSWTLPYLAWDLPETSRIAKHLAEIGQQGFEKFGGIHPGHPYLDFGSAGHLISPQLVLALNNKIQNCASPMAYIEDMPTVQNPLAVIKQYLIFEYVFFERKHNGYSKKAAIEDFENKLRHTENLLNWAYYWLRDREAEHQEVDASLGEFLHAIKSCWNIGETFRFTLIDNSAEIGPIKEEAEG